MRLSSRFRRSGVRSAKFIRRPAYVFFSIRIHEFGPLDSPWAYWGATSIAHIMWSHLVADSALADRELRAASTTCAAAGRRCSWLYCCANLDIVPVALEETKEHLALLLASRGEIAMKIAALLLVFSTLAIGPASFNACAIAQAGACCKVCQKGKACGDSCIARDKDCHKGPGCACDG